MTDQTDDNSTSEIVDIPEDYSAFREAFLNPDKPAAEDSSEEDAEADALATDEDTDAGDPDDSPDAEEAEDEDEGDDESDDESDDNPEPEPEPKKGKGKKSAQERINEITKRARESERREAALIQRLEALEAREREVSKQEPLKEALPQGAPNPDELDAEGNAKYPLGPYDPEYILALSRYTVELEYKAKEEKAAQEAEARKIAEQQQALKNDWSDKVAKAEEEIPDLRDHIEDLVTAFSSLEPAYGEYLATTIMTSENGPAIMEYLSQNIGEAQNIVRSGPAAATLAIGRLDARLSKPLRPNEEEKRKKVTSAATPPAQVTRGRKGHNTVREDTTDLAAFKRDFGF